MLNINIKRKDYIEIRIKIIPIDSERGKMISKPTLWNQQKKIKEGKAIKVYNKTEVRTG